MRTVCQENFYREVDQLKGKLKTKDSKITLYIEDSFYEKARNFLKKKMEKQLGLNTNACEEANQ